MSAVALNDGTDVRHFLFDEWMQTRTSGESVVSHVLGEIVQFDLGAGGHGTRALDGVLQLADVAWPLVTT